MTYETVTAALHNLQAQINEVMGLMKDAAKQPTKDDTATKLVQYAIRLAQLEGAFLTLQQHANAIIDVAKQYPVPPLPVAGPEDTEEDEVATDTEIEDEEESRVITTEDLATSSPTYRRSQEDQSSES